MGILGVQPPQIFFALEICQSPKVTVKLISVSPQSRIQKGFMGSGQSPEIRCILGLDCILT